MSSRPPLDRRHLLVDELLPLLGLAGFGYSLPLLDLVGTNPEFLVAHHLTGGALLAAALALALVPPIAVGASVMLVSWRWPRAGHLLWCGWVLLFGAMAAASLLRHLDLPTESLLVVLAGAGGVLALLAVRTWRGVRTGLAFLAATPLLAVLALATWSRSAELVWQRTAGPVEGVEVADPAPIVVLQLDELPLASLLRADGSLDGDRFPNFARLARQSTWLANTVAVAPSTTGSVPAAVSGTVPLAGDLPTASDHPRNLFTLLGEAYDLQVDEPVTALCPQQQCGGAVDWSDLANDAVGVAGQLWLPADLRDRLPSPLQRAADFDNVDALGGDSARARLDRVEAHIEGLEAGGERPPLWYAHVVLPHVPWTLGRTGAEYLADGAMENGPTRLGGWAGDPVLARVGLQRHLLQVGATDLLLGRLIDRLRHEGLWDDALVVVLADHGAAFEADQPYREPMRSTAHEIYRIPMFVKLPGQLAPETRLDLTYNVDVLPTILDVVGVEPDEGLDGRSILEPVVDRGPDAALYVADAGDAIHPDISFSQVIDIARRNAGLLPAGPGWRGVVAGGPLGPLVGVDVDDLDLRDPGPYRFRLEQQADLAAVDTSETGALPTFVWGALEGDAGSPAATPTDLLLALNGTVAGTLSRLADGTYAGILDEDLIHQGDNEVLLLVPDGDDGFATIPSAKP